MPVACPHSDSACTQRECHGLEALYVIKLKVIRHHQNHSKHLSNMRHVLVMPGAAGMYTGLHIMNTNSTRIFGSVDHDIAPAGVSCLCMHQSPNSDLYPAYLYLQVLCSMHMCMKARVTVATHHITTSAELRFAICDLNGSSRSISMPMAKLFVIL